MYDYIQVRAQNNHNYFIWPIYVFPKRAKKNNSPIFLVSYIKKDSEIRKIGNFFCILKSTKVGHLKVIIVNFFKKICFIYINFSKIGFLKVAFHLYLFHRNKWMVYHFTNFSTTLRSIFLSLTSQETASML